MALASGSRLGSYEILAPLSAGGMGEVFRARDLKLSREVALKVLPTEFALDAERLARFKREAQLLATLCVANRQFPQHFGIRHAHPALEVQDCPRTSFHL